MPKSSFGGALKILFCNLGIGSMSSRLRKLPIFILLLGSFVDFLLTYVLRRRQDRTISRATVAAKLRGIEFRRHLESVSDLFRIKKHGEVARLLEPLVTGNEESIDVDQRVSGSYGASDVDEFCSNEERIELFEMFATVRITICRFC
jgi:hypothetical protein